MSEASSPLTSLDEHHHSYLNSPPPSHPRDMNTPSYTTFYPLSPTSYNDPPSHRHHSSSPHPFHSVPTPTANFQPPSTSPASVVPLLSNQSDPSAVPSFPLPSPTAHSHHPHSGDQDLAYSHGQSPTQHDCHLPDHPPPPSDPPEQPITPSSEPLPSKSILLAAIKIKRKTPSTKPVTQQPSSKRSKPAPTPSHPASNSNSPLPDVTPARHKKPIKDSRAPPPSESKPAPPKRPVGSSKKSSTTPSGLKNVIKKPVMPPQVTPAPTRKSKSTTGEFDLNDPTLWGALFGGSEKVGFLSGTLLTFSTHEQELKKVLTCLP